MSYTLGLATLSHSSFTRGRGQPRVVQWVKPSGPAIVPQHTGDRSGARQLRNAVLTAASRWSVNRWGSSMSYVREYCLQASHASVLDCVFVSTPSLFYALDHAERVRSHEARR